MKKLSFASGVAAIALAAASIFPAAGVFAKTVATADYTSNPITLKRTITNVTNPVTNTFGYTITKGTTPTGGDVSGFPTTASIAFNNAAPSSNNSVEATTTVDFSAADFTKVGDYTFTIKENSSSDAANYPIDTGSNDYTALVEVRYYTDPTTHVPDNTRYVAYLTIKNKSGTKVGQATWTSGSTYTYIEATATTTGNMAEKGQCFEYTIEIPATVGGTYVIDIENSDTEATACSGSATSVTAGTPAKVYLKHGDTVRVGYNGGALQLPVGTQYKITETDTDYTEKFDGTAKLTTTKTAVAQDASTFETDNKTALENNKQSDPLTGIVTNFWFYLILLIAGAFGFFFFMRKRQQDDEEQQQA